MKHDFEALKAFMEEHIPFNALLGIRLVYADEGEAHLSIPFQPHLIGDPFRPAIHGGVLSALIDTAGGTAVFTLMDLGDKCSTVDMRIDYLRPGRSADLLCRARVLRMGNRVAAVQAAVYQEGEDEPIADGRAVYNIKRSGDGPG